MFGDADTSDDEVKFETRNEYAKNYDKWRRKEHFNTLRARFEDASEDDDSSTTDDDDDDIEIPENVEKDFLKTLSSLHNKDPKIYDESIKFFDDKPIDPSVRKKNKEAAMTLKDYERKMLIEYGDKDYDNEHYDHHTNESLTYVEEQNQIKSALKSKLDNLEQETEEGVGGLFKSREKTNDEKEKEELDYKQWLKGQKDNLDDAEDETNLKPLKEYWNDPNLDASEKFLRDYILNNRFQESSDPNYVPTYDEIIHDDEDFTQDESNVDKQEEFEHKFNHRFEEPDQEYLKRFPRTVENSLRKSDDRRKIKRQELKERKQREKQEKMEELQKLKELKKQEIEEKIKKLKEITGNSQVAFDDKDVDDDFDPEAHDKRMQSLFDDEFYEGEEGDEKPEFPEWDDELEIERWDKNYKPEDEIQEEPHVEDEDFNMDCDYDPSQSKTEEEETMKGRKKRRRKSKFAKAVSTPKPEFNPEDDKTYEQYLDEYYKLDCEDIISGIPCRFKYRKVTPNTFGLTIDEILRAKDRELNQWCSLKKAIQYRPEYMEKYDQIAYNKKAQNEELKRRILPSLYQVEEEQQPTTSTAETSSRKPQKKPTEVKSAVETPETSGTNNKNNEVNSTTTSNTKRKRKATDEPSTSNVPETSKTKKKKKKQPQTTSSEFSDARLQAFGIKPKKFKNKLKYGKQKN